MNFELNKLENSSIVRLYTEILKELKNRNVIRGKNLVGDLGEYLVMDYFKNNLTLPNLEMAPPSNKSYDAIDENGKTYAIKTVTNNVTGVFYGLNSKNSVKEEKKIFDFAIVNKLDDNYTIERIYLLSWEVFLEHKKWHSRMKAWNLNISQKLKNYCLT